MTSTTDPGAPGAARPRPTLIMSLSATVLAVVVVLVVLATAVGVLAFTRDEGAASPDEAARAMIVALEAGDAIGILELLPPGERRGMAETLPVMGAELQRLGLLTGLDVHDVTDADLRFRDVVVRSSSLAKDIAAIELVGGTMQARLPAGVRPLTDHARDLLRRFFDVTIESGETTVTRDFGIQPLRIIAVTEGGGWHVSLAYSVADAVRLEHQAALPDIGEGKGSQAIGADTPGDAVGDLLKAYADGDPERVVTLLYPDEARALYDYGPIFIPEARAAALRAAERNLFDVQLNPGFRVTVEGAGDTRIVHVNAYDVDIRDEVKQTHVTYDGRCFHTDYRLSAVDDPYESYDSCNGDHPSADERQRPRDNPLSTLAIFGKGADLPTFTVIERNGRWFISPVRTVLESIVTTLQALQPDDVDAFAARLAASLRGGVGDGITAAPVEPFSSEEVAADPARAMANAQALIDRCAALTSGEKAAAVTERCVQRLLEMRRISGATRRDDGRWIAALPNG